ncbi:chemotaxis response regulator protein-glutamate methylesterase [Vibrio fluvialis]|jgi:two-component system chemotaxis response regulator CheB|uniref:protein-glutamate methylesterase/protein-glutamine glutaminase n=1 Tax=Vibrio fluvialis TaxID=676 RepID=UPI0015596AD7|nr:chemotaxis response regulator protein-glutamate methylesterase [Vibrio fluvialis]EKO3493363.1 chemotaxis response regulator protein-glutamate methylesterase [Vibrio fluvialis]EMC0409832.1 chemotaxis response regulator protein-glutamate methylesterase [Vibrio fluvialis]MBL4240425.1 chemotaxis response regulator protein-glutamate methylesterase [Vibrio fluvialis]MBL4267300.1 chemotaxis response regulator protein-glutamate methylesterase [Vibrio fluvialis]MBL4271689.1 chemotaxis response regul
MSKKIRVLVVDDSPVFRALLTQLIESDPDLEVVASAEDPYQARELIKRYNPDVLTLDIEMPRMNGVQFLKNLMRLRPMPVVMISTLAQHGAEPTLTALELGAVDYFPKPSVENTADMVNYKALVNEKIKMAAGANVASVTKSVVSAPVLRTSDETRIQLLAIGASTGGTEAVKSVLSALPATLPPIVITQHISAMFTPSFAKRLDEHSAISVHEVVSSHTPLKAGHAYLAPGDRHMVVIKRGAQLYADLDDRAAVNRHKPSVDVMFDSVAEVVGDRAVGIILTGMGQDGARGMLKMRQQGAPTVAQDEKSSVVWGMPRVAVELGGAQDVRSLNAVPQWICEQIELHKIQR